MGIFSPLAKRNAYVPPSDRANSPTLLTGADPNLVRVSGGDDPQTSSETQLAQGRAPAASAPQLPPEEQRLMTQPGRGYGAVSQAKIEQGMSPLQKSVNRNQALLEIASRSPPPGAIDAPLPEMWQRDKPSEFVDALQRAVQRHNLPMDMFARQMYQEGKFNERGGLRSSWDGTPEGKTRPVGLAQMTTRTFDELKQRAQLRGDLDRVKELESYSPMNPVQAFDAAAEHLAYLHRRLGGWPAAVAAYNYSLPYVENWLKGSNVRDPIDMKVDVKMSNGQIQKYDRWKEVTNYVSNALQNEGPSPQMGDMYAQQQSSSRIEKGFKVAAPVPSPNAPDIWRVSRDTRENP